MPREPLCPLKAQETLGATQPSLGAQHLVDFSAHWALNWFSPPEPLAGALVVPNIPGWQRVRGTLM